MQLQTYFSPMVCCLASFAITATAPGSERSTRVAEAAEVPANHTTRLLVNDDEEEEDDDDKEDDDEDDEDGDGRRMGGG